LSTRLFKDTLFASSLPPAAIEAASANLSIMKSAMVLRLEDGTLYGWEGVGCHTGCCEGSCTHVWNYTQAFAFLFPALERSMRVANYRYNTGRASCTVASITPSTWNCTAHTKEYVRFWQGYNTSEDIIPALSLWDHIPRYEWHWNMWNEVDAYNYGVVPMTEFFEKTKADHATDIIENMWGGLGKPFYINTANGSSVPNMPADAFLEMLCDSTMDAVTPRAVGSAPVGLRGLWQQMLDTHELAVRAAVSADRDTLYAAFACDPLPQSLADTRRLINDLLEAEKAALPPQWF